MAHDTLGHSVQARVGERGVGGGGAGGGEGARISIVQCQRAASIVGPPEWAESLVRAETLIIYIGSPLFLSMARTAAGRRVD